MPFTFSDLPAIDRTKLPQFEAIAWWSFPGGWSVETRLDRDTHGFEHIVGRNVMIDGVAYHASGVERFAHCAPWYAGEEIAIHIMGGPPKWRGAP